ncbi:hypothetical protein D5086_029810 [Populus alba]|uniref:Uncharacterized protein n=1 Tax=Populus alba TaxID=43335 RepID=A0ACC4AUM7_POPAL
MESGEFRGAKACGKGFWISLLLFLCMITTQVKGSIHEYRNEAFTTKSNAFFFHGGSEGLYASKASRHLDSSASSQSGKSFIRFEGVTFRRTKESASRQEDMQPSTGVVEAIILDVKDRERIGGAFLKTSAICCNHTLAETGSCKLGEVIFQKNSDNPKWPRVIKTDFAGKNEEAKLEADEIEINSNGMYYLYFMFCNPELKGTVINGRTVWKNPNGYLPGKMTPLMTFFGIMSLAYLVLGLAWFLRFVQFWKDIIHLHYHITAVIALGMCEMAVWYFEYVNFNSTGLRPMGITLWAVTFTTVKKTLSRLLLLVVSMGFGVVRPTLGGITSKVLLLGLMRRNMAKLELYRKFTNALAVSVLLSIAWIGFELYFNATDPLSELWQVAWIIPAFWTLLAYSLLVVICVLWAPSRNPTRYAYSEGEDLDEEGISLTTGDIANKLERNALVEDLEEDKRE